MFGRERELYYTKLIFGGKVMRQLYYKDKIMVSWKKCIKNGIDYQMQCPKKQLTEFQLQNELNIYKNVIVCFTEVCNLIIDLLHMPICFCLFDNKSILLKKICTVHGKNFERVKEGISFSEDSCGTNAVDLSRRIKKEVYTTREENYCMGLLNFYIYARYMVDLGIHDFQLAILSESEILFDDMALCELIEESLKRDMHVKLDSILIQNCQFVELNKKQLDILILIARGMTDKAIGIEKGICIDTVKYHKKNIFHVLDVSCSVQAVIKSLKLHIISIDEI